MIKANPIALKFLDNDYAFDSDIKFKSNSYDVFGNNVKLTNIKENLLDSKINKSSILLLSNMTNLDDNLVLSSNQISKNIKTTFTQNGNRWSYSNNVLSLKNIDTVYSVDDYFNIEIIDNETVYIYHYVDNVKLYLKSIDSGNSTSSIVFATLDSSDADSFTFSYFKFDTAESSYIVLFKTISNQRYYIKTNDNSIGLSPLSVDLNNLDQSIYFYINFFNIKNEFNFNNKYISYNRNEFNNIFDKDKVKEIKNNFLLEAPFNITTDNKSATNLIPLKNEFNSNDQQSFDSIVPNLESNQFRSYRKIFSGVSQNEGDYNINLSYENFSTKYDIKAGKINYFNLPQNTAQYLRININSLNLQAQGAIPGDHPLRADKVFKKKADYKNTTNFGSPSDERNGRFLCAWLKKEEGGSVWYDRYYFPSKISERGAYRSYGKVYNSLEQVTENFDYIEIFDIPSNLTFEPGCYYAYHHIGDTDVNNIIKDLDKNIINDKIDSIEIKGSSSNYVFPNKAYTNKLSLSFGVTVTKENFAHEIIGNYDNNGISIYNTDNITPIFYNIKTLSSNNYIECYNNDLVMLHNNKLTFTPTDIKVRKYLEDIIVVGNQTSPTYLNSDFIFTSTTSAYIMTYDMKTKIEISIPSSIIAYENNFVYFYVNGTGGGYLRLDLNNIEQGFVAYDIKKTINSFGNFLVYQGIIYEGNYDKMLQYNGKGILCLSKADNKIYLYDFNDLTIRPYIRGNSNIYDFSLDGSNIIVTYKDSFSSDNRVVVLDENLVTLADFNSVNKQTISTFVVKEFHKSTYEKYLLLYDGASKKLDKYDFNGNLILSGTTVFDKLPTDINGNNYTQSHITDEITNALFIVKVKLINKISKKVFEKSYYIAKPYNFIGKHYVGVSMDSSTGTIAIYLNSQNITTDRFDINQYDFYNTINSSFIIGKSTFFNNVPLNEYINKPEYYVYEGLKLNDIAIYDKFLTDIDYLNIYRQYVPVNDMIINIPVFKNNCIDTIEKFFKFKGTGAKTNKFNLIINNAEILSDSIKEEIETAIHNNIAKITPVESELNNIKWQ